SVGAVAGINPEHLVENLTDGGQGIEPPPLHLFEQAAQLGVLLYLFLEVPPCTRGRDLEDLRREIAPPALLELALGLEPRTVLLDLLPERVDAFAAHRLGEDDRRTPAVGRPE